MRISKVYLIFLWALFFINFCGCTADFFNFSNEDKTKGSASGALVFSTDIKENMLYCNKFNNNEFNGILIADYDKNEAAFNMSGEKAQLFLWNVPYEFTHPSTNYIQFHAFYIANNKTVFNKVPVTIEMIAHSSSRKPILVTTIGHDLLKEIGITSISKLIETHYFVLKDLNGWNGVSLSIFNVHDKLVKTTQILIPPFSANPHTYQSKNNRERVLFELHPFHDIAYNNEQDNVFYEKGVAFCNAAPVQLEVPLFKNPSDSTDDNGVDNLIEDLSFFSE